LTTSPRLDTRPDSSSARPWQLRRTRRRLPPGRVACAFARTRKRLTARERRGVVSLLLSSIAQSPSTPDPRRHRRGN
jgi:hypothetical protein